MRSWAISHRSAQYVLIHGVLTLRIVCTNQSQTRILRRSAYHAVNAPKRLDLIDQC